MADRSEIALRVSNIIVGILLAICGVWMFFYGFTQFIVGVYILLAGAVLIVLEFFTPDFVVQQCAFLTNFLGRGLFYIFCGCLVLDNLVGFRLFAGIITIIAGVVFIIFHFVPSIQPPHPKGWIGSRQNLADTQGSTQGAVQV